MTSDHHVAATYLRLLLEYLQQRQLDPSAVLGADAASVLLAHQAQQTTPVDGSVVMVSRSQFCALLGQMRVVCQDPTLALALGRNISAAHLGVLGYLLLACANLAEALIKMDHYARLIYDGHQMQVLAEGDQIDLIWDMPAPVGDETIFAELGMAVVVQFARNLTGVDDAMTKIAFRHSLDGSLAPYTEFFGCPVLFDQPQTILRFPACFLALPLRQPDAMLLGILEAQAAHALAHLPKSDAFVREVQALIMRLCLEGAPTLAQVADQLCMTPRTLQRRLAEHGTRFQPVLDETRQQLCRQYLADPRLQLTDVAHLLGYSDQSAFTRAYRRWTGHTPHGARRPRL